MDKKRFTKEDNDNFWAAFDMRHPEISKHLNKEFVENSLGFTAFQPKTMDGNTFRIYLRYMERWIGDNGFSEPRKDFVEVTTSEGVKSVDTSTIEKIDLDDSGKTRIVFKDDGTGNIKAILVHEDLEKLKASVYIF